MPSTYAHYRMGLALKKKLTGRTREAVEAFPELYMIGLHGPDILYYYHPLKRNAVVAEGDRLHEGAGRRFFARAREVIRKSRNQKAAIAYTCGLMNHFALDVSCHAFVDAAAAHTGITHTEIEVEFDRELMLEDGLNPVTRDLTGHIRPTRENAELIAPFYPGLSTEEVLDSLRGMVMNSRLLRCRTGLKRRLAYLVFRLAGKYEELRGHIMKPEGNPRCRASNRRLRKLYRLAEQRAGEMMDGFEGYLEEKTPFSAIFDYNFNGRRALPAPAGA